ncbi:MULTISPECIES: head-tail connector protein [Clostridium]|uniref:head-tail connector protein n=1 Tax=Clostridium TaxID=1485 RepID=UPI0006526918|nr:MULTISPECIES: head-tail connector protein [Clostridium]
MVSLEEIKEWIRIDGDDEDKTLSSLISSSRFSIERFTGVSLKDIKEAPEEAQELYKTLQKFIITDVYDNRSGGDKIPLGMVSACTQLECYRNGNKLQEF